MRISQGALACKVVVRRVGTGAAPFGWEVQNELTGSRPVVASPERYRSMEAAFADGQIQLARFLLEKGSARRTRPAATLSPKQPFHNEVDLQDEDEVEDELEDEDVLVG